MIHSKNPEIFLVFTIKSFLVLVMKMKPFLSRFKLRQLPSMVKGLLLAGITFSLVVINSTLMVTVAPVTQAAEVCQGQAILTASTCAGDELSSEEAILAQLINNYRTQNNLPAIPLSRSLTLVANRHVRDMDENIGTLTHSWSSCDVSRDWNCSWQAPQRLRTAYPGRGYENAYSSSIGATAQGALNGWKNDPPHNDLIINRGIWQNYQWNALGVGIYKGYAVMWVGVEPDPAPGFST